MPAEAAVATAFTLLSKKTASLVFTLHVSYAPSPNRITRSQTFHTSCRCVTSSTVRSSRDLMDSTSARSVSLSSAEVASSNNRMGHPLYSARATASRCVCPSESPEPFSPNTVSYPSGSCSTNSAAQAISKAQRTRSPKISFDCSAKPTTSRIVPLIS